MARLGVIDLGSNSVRLVIYEAKKDLRGPKPFRTLADEKKMAGLAAYVEAGRFTDAGIARAADILDGHLGIARNLDCDRVDIFATAVLRNCSNSEAAVSTIEEAIGHAIVLLSAEEEAALGLAGARIGQGMGPGTLIDIGGGSTELTVLAERGHADKDARSASLPLGSVSSYAQFVRLVLPDAQECAAISEHLRSLLADAGLSPAFRHRHFYGIGGSVRAIVKMQAQALAMPAKPARIERSALDALFGLLESDASAFAHAAVKAAPDRVHTLVPGMVIVRTLMAVLGGEDVTVCKYGIREGYLMERMLRG